MRLPIEAIEAIEAIDPVDPIDRQHARAWLRRLALAGTSLPLAACMNLSGLDGSSEYGCQAPAGVACESVSGTYYNSLKNNLPVQRARGSTHATPQSSIHATPQDWPAAGSRAPRFTSTALSAPDSAQPGAGEGKGEGDARTDPAPAAEPMPLRSAGRTLGLWFKPWKDADGDLFDEGHVYIQVDNGDWLIDHVQQRIRDAYAPVRAPKPLPSTARSGGAASAATTALTPGRSITDAARALQASGPGRPSVTDDPSEP